MRHDGRADVLIRILRPEHGGADGIRHVHAGEPAALGAGVRAGVDLLDDVVGPAGRVRELVAAAVALGDVGVPGVVQVGRGAVEGDGDIVAADLVGLVVQRLRDVPQEVHEELERRGDLCLRQLGRRLHARRVVRDGADGAPGGPAVAVVVDGAARGRVVLGVDEVEGRGKFASSSISV